MLVTAVGALLWYVVFPWAEPLLPFDDVQVTDDSGVPADPGESGAPGVGDQQPPNDEHDIPYSTNEPATPR